MTHDESLWRRLDLGLSKVTPGVVGQVSCPQHYTQLDDDDLCQVLSRGCAVLRLSRATVLQPVFTSSVTGLSTFPTSQLESSRSDIRPWVKKCFFQDHSINQSVLFLL